MKARALLLAGVMAPVVYSATVVFGGMITPGYSHLSQYVSELIAAGAPNRALLNLLFAIYNLFVLAFGVGIYLLIRRNQESRRRTVGIMGAFVLVLEGLAGILTLFFPQDPIGSPATSTGTMHIVLASVSSLTSMLTMLFLGLWFWVIPALRKYAVYSLVSVAVVFVSGGIAASTIAHPSPLSGLIERVTILGFIQWVFVMGKKMYGSELSTDVTVGNSENTSNTRGVN
jgi:hypothetical membrane protein